MGEHGMKSLRLSLLFVFMVVQKPLNAHDQQEAFTVAAPQMHETQQELLSSDDEDKETKRILTTFLSMLGNFAAILSDPKNPNVVGSQIAQILSGVLAIAMEAFNKSKTDEQKQDLEHCLLDEEFLKALKEQFIAYADQLKAAHVC